MMWLSGYHKQARSAGGGLPTGAAGQPGGLPGNPCIEPMPVSGLNYLGSPTDLLEDPMQPNRWSRWKPASNFQ